MKYFKAIAIRAHLLAGNTITTLEAVNTFGCLRLASRIHDLKRIGVAVKSRTVNAEKKIFLVLFITILYILRKEEQCTE